LIPRWGSNLGICSLTDSTRAAANTSMAALMLTRDSIIENHEGRLRARDTTRLITAATELYRVEASYSYTMWVILANRQRARLVAKTGSGRGDASM
jgi:hypothetical protein